MNLFENYTSTAVLANADEATLTRISSRNFERNILPLLPADRQAKVLDIGCGYGRYLKALESSGYVDVYGIDVSEEQIAYARERLGLRNCMCGDALEFLGDQSGTYDVILLLDVMEHLDIAYAVELCRAVHRALKPGGLFVVQVPNGLSPMSPHLHADVTHQRAFTTQSVEQVLRRSGFSGFRHSATPMPVHGLKSLIRRTVWELVVNPLLKAYFLVVVGSTLGGIYTPNLLTATTKSPD
jgi:2-polyprenyl-3-methyl-5-hydroxy-6-metoxy-1,4-benzoquinol methylase